MSDDWHETKASWDHLKASWAELWRQIHLSRAQRQLGKAAIILADNRCPVAAHLAYAAMKSLVEEGRE